jgi:NitT/TauT family transport system ATP-binding protein
MSFERHPAGSLLVLDGLDLTLASGEFCSVIGPSGCGKTTLLQLVMGLTNASSGAIERGDARLAMVFQRPRLLPWRSALDNATYGLECSGALDEARREDARVLLDRLGLSDHLADLPHQLSEGMQQRVNLARALLMQPELLLMDEPFAALDLLTRRRLQDQLLELWRERRFAVLFVSHSIDEVVAVSERVLVLTDKPAKIKASVSIALAYPRARSAGGQQPFVEQVRAIECLLSD